MRAIVFVFIYLALAPVVWAEQVWVPTTPAEKIYQQFFNSVAMKETEKAKELIAKALPENLSPSGVRPSILDLTIPITYDNLEIFKLLIEKGADLNSIDAYSGNSLLYYATTYRREKMAGILIKAGVDLNHQNKEGKTALHEAAQNAFPEIALLLCSCGIDQTLRDREGRTALDIAERQVAIWDIPQPGKRHLEPLSRRKESLTILRENIQRDKKKCAATSRKPTSNINSNAGDSAPAVYPIEQFSIGWRWYGPGILLFETNIDSKGPITGFHKNTKKIEGMLSDAQKTAIETLFLKYDVLHLESTKYRNVNNLFCDGQSELEVLIGQKEIWSDSGGCGECYPEKSCEFSLELGMLVSKIYTSTYTDVSACKEPSCIELVAINTKNPALCSSIKDGTEKRCLSKAIMQSQKKSDCFEYYKAKWEVEACLSAIGTADPNRF